jgi:16S rRNA (guanine(966)-N(2))-methyltransferase RsmD
MEAARFLDLYAGSGAVGIEALSRGAESVVFVEKAPPALKALRANLERLGIRAGVKVHAGSVASTLKRAGEERFDVVFLDPPYDLEKEYETALGLVAGLVAEGGVVVAEHRRKDKLEDAYGALQRTRLLEQGDAALSFYALVRGIEAGES